MTSKKQIFCVFLLHLTIIAGGQSITREKANSLLLQLEKTPADTGRLKILVELGKFHIYKPGEAKSDLDSAFFYLEDAKKLNKNLKSEKWDFEIESVIAIGTMEKGEDQQGHALVADLINRFRKKGDNEAKEAEAALRFKFGIWLSTKVKNYPEVLDNYNQAMALYKETKNQEQEIRVLKETAIIHLNQGNLDLAEIELEDVIRRYKMINYKRLHYAYDLLSAVNRLKGNLNKALDYSLKSLESMENTHDTVLAANFYASLGRVNLEIGNRQKGMEWYKKAVEKWRSQGFPSFAMFYAAGVIVQELISQVKPKDGLRFIFTLSRDVPPLTQIQKGCIAQNLAYCYEALGNYREAEKLYLEMMRWYKQTGNDLEATQRAPYDIGKFYLHQKQFTKAGYYLRSALAFDPQKNELAIIKDIHLMLFAVDSAEGHFLSAIDHFRQHKLLNDSIFNEKKSRQIEELQIKYETVKKEQDIRLLQNINNSQQISLHEADTVKKLTFLGLALLLVILFLLNYQYQVKKRNNKEIKEKNSALQQLVKEKEWLVKEIHHRVKNNLQLIISLFNAQSEFLDNPSAIEAINKARERMQSIALIHQKLYLPNQENLINVASYLTDMISHLKSSLANVAHIAFNLDINNINLDVSQGVPVGLILNEAITNSIKHAFPENRKGTIFVSLKDEGENLVLTIKDNGIGFATQCETSECASLGIQLIKLFSEQLEGALSIQNDQGAEISLSFKPQYFDNPVE
ncbi:MULTISPECIES: tetratricopeptide repeat-containing sensor histidine kinase [Niastella]|uniref:histidine kinase n=1 Tax=Niastella soli TaxID=2821487 RepID=A0ABS3Z3U0_9BACT|nr:histidine kinase dimerization/phosphoacceptor domain -containing protein [Niastella soli]MBO9204831.1 ATP-binding protein [Niastella soli]